MVKYKTGIIEMVILNYGNCKYVFALNHNVAHYKRTDLLFLLNKLVCEIFYLELKYL